MSVLLKHRVPVYWGLALILLVVAILLNSMEFTAPKGIHLLLDSVSALAAMFATIMVFFAFNRTQSVVLLIIGLSLAGASLFEFAHQLADTSMLKQFIRADIDSFIQWSWYAGRFSLGLGLLIAAIYSNQNVFTNAKREDELDQDSLMTASVIMVLILISGFMAIFRTELFAVYSMSAGGLLLPDLAGSMLLLAAFAVFYVKGNWRTDSYGHWVNLGIVAALCGQLFFMSQSESILDSSFVLAHMISVMSYGIIAIGFIDKNVVTPEAEPTPIEA